MAKSSNQKLKILYIMKMLLEKTDEQNTLSVSDMIYNLSLYGINAERKSIYDDLNMLQIYGLPIVCTKGKTYGYYIEHRQFSQRELKLLATTVASSKFLSEKTVWEMVQKLGKLTSSNGAKELRRQIFVHNRNKVPFEKMYYNIDVIHEAIEKNKQIAFRYFDYTVKKEKAYKDNGERRPASPYGITFDDETYYLICHYEQYDSVVHFRIDRMEDIEVLDIPIVTQDSGFDIGRHVEKTFQRYGGIQPQYIKIKFHNSLISAVLERFGEDCRLEESENNSFILRANIVVTPTFLGWLFQFGNMAEILAPNSLIEQLRGKAKELLKRYEKEG